MERKQLIIGSLLAVVALPLPVVAGGENLTLASTIQQVKAGIVKGVVYDSMGEPIIGASVKVQGSKTAGTVTNIDGQFELKNVSAGSTIEISYIGCKAKTVKARVGQELKITLEDDSKTLDDVVVVGFATQKKVNLTGSVGVATSKDLEGRPVTNVMTCLLYTSDAADE